MNKNSVLLFSFSLLIMMGCSESEQVYIEANESEMRKASVDINRQSFDNFPFHDVPEWRYDVAEYQGPYSESGEYYQEQNIIAPVALRNTVTLLILGIRC